MCRTRWFGVVWPIMGAIVVLHMHTQKLSSECRFYNTFYVIKAGLWITTECGKLQVSPGEIVVLPGFCFAIKLSDCRSHGYVTKVFGIHFQLPELGPIGIALMCQWSDFSKGLSCSHSLV
ncbi:homogentisate 1,2-dioxygenase isoform X2 [Elaeis guineensis]|uniref:homogentisate 1,2-dioxygenase isoform X2 n=1 Tax=Elaeis guineensis var. tenera TaxID=51953 RepID=UPI003C6D00DC